MQMDLTLKGGHRAGVCDWLSYYLNSWNCWAAGLCMTEACESPWHLVGFSACPSIGFSANTVSLIKLKQQVWAEQLLSGFSSSRDQGRSITPRSRVPQRPPRSLNLYAKTKSLYFKLEFSLCLMQWWEQREPWGRIFFFFIIVYQVGGERISRVQDPDWLTFVLGYLGKRGIDVCWAQGHLVI